MMHGVTEGWEAWSELNLILRGQSAGSHNNHRNNWGRHSFSIALVVILLKKNIEFCCEKYTLEIMILSTEDSQLNWQIKIHFSSVQFSSDCQLCPTLCDPMNRSTPGFPVHHQLPEFTQTHVHRVGDAIQPSQPLSSPSPAHNPSQHQSLFQWVNSLHKVTEVLELQL